MDADRKKLVFLFGAGTSAPAGCKTTQQLTDRLIQIIDEDKYISVLSECSLDTTKRQNVQ